MVGTLFLLAVVAIVYGLYRYWSYTDESKVIATISGGI